jgi:ribosomal protein S18 acetylase RimI-like enzyme
VISVRLLGPGDEAVLGLLNDQDADFDLEGRGGPGRPLAAADAAAYLADEAVRHWVAEEDGSVLGFNLCYVLRRRNDAAREVLLFEIGVRRDARRRGVGRALVAALRAFMEREGIEETWVLADNPGAVAFYAACGFVRDDEQGVQMLLTRSRPERRSQPPPRGCGRRTS